MIEEIKKASVGEVNNFFKRWIRRWINAWHVLTSPAHIVIALSKSEKTKNQNVYVTTTRMLAIGLSVETTVQVLSDALETSIVQYEKERHLAKINTVPENFLNDILKSTNVEKAKGENGSTN